jgi:hypothetical protein
MPGVYEGASIASRDRDDTGKPTMQYLLLIYDNEKQMAERMGGPESDAFMAEYFAYTQALKDAGAFIAGDALQGTATATSVQIRGGERMITDGPFAETKEQLGGYYLVDVENLDKAIEWGAKIPTSRYGTIEVRPLMTFDEE